MEVTKIFKITVDDPDRLNECTALCIENKFDIIEIEEITNKLAPSEAIYSFIGFLNGLDIFEESIWDMTSGPFTIEHLLKIFLEENNLEGPRHGIWPNNIKIPSIDKNYRQRLLEKEVEEIGVKINIDNLMKTVHEYHRLGGTKWRT